MPARHRQLLDWRYRDEMTFAAIAARWQVSEAAVHRMHGRILAALLRRFRERRITRLDEVL